MSPTAAGRALLARFEMVRIISLPAREDRRREIREECARLGVAIDGGQVRFFNATSFTDSAGFPSIGARGCFDSHVGVLAEAVASQARSVLILEDDADFAAGIERDLPPLLAELDTGGWSLFYGGFLERNGVAPPRRGRTTLVQALPDDRLLGSHCVGLSGEAIRAAHEYFLAMRDRAPGSPLGGPMHVDGAYGWFRRTHPVFTTAIAVPPVAVQRPSRTDVHAPGVIDRTRQISSLVSLARRAKRWIRRPA